MFDLGSLLGGLGGGGGNMLTSLFGQGQQMRQQPGAPLDITGQGAAAQPQIGMPLDITQNGAAAQAQAPQSPMFTPQQTSDAMKRFQMFGAMGAAPQAKFAPVQFSAGNGNGLSSLVGQMMQRRGQ